jgi:hypothetical protein
VDLVVDGRDLAARVEQHRAVHGPAMVRIPAQRRAHQDRDAQVPGRFPQGAQHGVVAKEGERLQQPRPVALDNVGRFGRQDEPRPARRGLADQRQDMVQGGV